MNTERKRVVAVATDSPLLTLPKDSTSFFIKSPSGNLCAWLFGVAARQESDTELALRKAISLLHLEHKFVIKPLDIVIENGTPRFDWENAFQKEMNEIQPGEAWVDPATAKIYERMFIFERVEDGGRELFFLRADRSRPKRLHGISSDLAPFIGRKTELQKLKEWVEQIQEDQGQIISLIAPAGMGKTRLTTASKEWLQSQNIPYFQGGHSPYEGQLYSSFRSIIQSLKTSKNHQDIFSSMTVEEQSFVQLLLQPGSTIAALSHLKEEEIRKGIFETVKHIFLEAGKKPIVFIFEDFHWADANTIHLLDSIVSHLESLHILILTLHRPEFVPPWNKLLNYNQMELKPFTINELEELLKTLLSVEIISTRFIQDFYKLSMGNPLFVEELLRQLFETGVVEIEDGNQNQKYLRVNESKMKSIPSTLHAIIAARFDGLPMEEREGLRWAALFGTRFQADELEAFLAFQQFSNVKAILINLFDRTFLRERSSFPQRVYEFTHDMIFEVVRESIPERERKRRHTQIARFLQQFHRERVELAIDRIAEHFIKGEPQLEAFQTAIRAGEVMSNTHQYERALYFYREANKCLET